MFDFVKFDDVDYLFSNAQQGTTYNLYLHFHYWNIILLSSHNVIRKIILIKVLLDLKTKSEGLTLFLCDIQSMLKLVKNLVLHDQSHVPLHNPFTFKKQK
jgi:hypothetical protein